MDFRDHQALIMDNWMGVWNRDDPQCPLDHLAGAQNVEPVSGGIGIRSSFALAQALAAGVNVSQFQKFNRDVGSEGYIYFDENTRNLYHTANHAPTTAIYTAPAGTTGFSMLCLYDRAYLCFHNYNFGVTGSKLKVYYERVTNISTTSAANPTTVTTAAEHGLQTGAVVNITGNGTPAVNGTHTITVTGLTTFTIPVLGGGAGGQVSGWIIRDAMGAVPTVGAFAAAENVAAGVVSAGVHLFRVAYLTDTGFITRMSSAVQMTATGNRKVDLTNIPTGPAGAGITGRHILATKAINGYDGNPDNYEFFFVTLLADNSTTSITGLNFFDSALVNSADYLLDVLGSLPAPMGLCPYNGRVAYWGFPNDALSDYGYMYFSGQNDPEVISLAKGINKIPANDGGSRSIYCLSEYRGSIYAFKRGKTYAAVDNGGDPSTWSFQLVDAGFGCEALFGIARVEDGQIGIHKETIFAANFNGLYAFQGSWTERPLTWKIENEWRSISEATFNRIKVVVQPTEQRIYVLFPSSYSGGSWPANRLWVGDYKLGLDADNIRWFHWEFYNANPPTGAAFKGISHLQSESVLASSGTSRGLLLSFFGTAQPGMWRLTDTYAGGDTLLALTNISASLAAGSSSNDNFVFDPTFATSHLHALRALVTQNGTPQALSFTVEVFNEAGSSDSILLTPTITGVPVITLLTNLNGVSYSYQVASLFNNFAWVLQRLILFHNPLWEEGEM